MATIVEYNGEVVEMENKRKPFYYESRFWVGLYAFVMLIMMMLQLVLGLLQNQEIVVRSVTLNKFINGEVDLPMEALSWFWVGLVSLFCGFDRFVDVRTTMHLSSGQMSLGDLAKLRAIIVESLVLFLLAVACNLLVDKDFQLAQMASAFGSATVIYVSGNKLVKAYKWTGSKDDDKDGIPDEVQDEYEAWVRAQKKEGTDGAYITFDYFLDDRPDAKAILEKKRRRQHATHF